MSAQEYWNNNQNYTYQNNNQQPYVQGQDGHSSSYGQDQSCQSHQPGYGRDNEHMNWGYGGGDQQTQPPQQSHNYYEAGHNTQHYSSHDQNYSYDQSYPSNTQSHDPYQSHNVYNEARHSPQPPLYNSFAPEHNRQPSPNPYPTSQYPDQGFSAQPHAHQAYPAGAPNQADGERGLLGAIGGAAAGGFAGHKVNHGFIGAVGGAYAGHKLEDKVKDKRKKDKKEKKYGPGGRRDSSSSSSDSSSDDEKKKHKKYGAAAGVGGGAAAYAHHQQQQHQRDGHQAMAGNFSASSTQISLDRDYDLIASCADAHGNPKLSSISLKDCLTNSWGQLQWARGGGFGASSRNVRLVDGGRVLEAELGDGRGGWNVSHIRLDERITNNNGDLQFLG